MRASSCLCMAAASVELFVLVRVPQKPNPPVLPVSVMYIQNRRSSDRVHKTCVDVRVCVVQARTDCDCVVCLFSYLPLLYIPNLGLITHITLFPPGTAVRCASRSRLEKLTPWWPPYEAHASFIAQALKTCADELSSIAQALKTCADELSTVAHRLKTCLNELPCRAVPYCMLCCPYSCVHARYHSSYHMIPGTGTPGLYVLYC